MTINAYIKLVPASTKQTISVDELIELLEYYKEITAKTASQVNWKYEQAAFPYEMKEQPNDNNNEIHLFSNDDRYREIFIFIEQENLTDENHKESSQTFIKITLSKFSTYGDKGKANEFCKFIAKKLQGELHLFNGRIMYYYRRK
ncbi:DUF1885 family protein [Bacillus sp. V3B]|uniref:DUF1885 family protein n=1 Tax=Bacillus sp. V3B TaxID=2804915 RepID=UPI002108D6F2|nr:DUF1885 family protein [Bacillus sp. V3B]MCQ6275112.1 DUF1885 family protein [Bacillus sp. V3B]